LEQLKYSNPVANDIFEVIILESYLIAQGSILLLEGEWQIFAAANILLKY
jgi:hypothetical protein